MGIARGQNDRVCAGERRGYENRWLVDHPAHEIRNERNVETCRVSDRGAIRHSETEQIDGVNGIRSRECVDVVSPFVRPRGSVNAVQQENGWAAAALGEGDPPVAPFKPALFASDQAVMDASPFTHIPKVPGGAFTWAPLGWLTLLGAVLIALGLAAFARRDVQSG